MMNAVLSLDQGLGEHFIYGKIHGYEHRPNRRQIIRLNAYNNPDGDENPYYVYDMAIETHAVDQGGL